MVHIHRHQVKFACLGEHIHPQHAVVLGKTAADCRLILNSGGEQKDGNIYFDLNTRKRIPYTLPAHSMVSFSFDNQLARTRTLLYSRAMHDAGQLPQYTTP